MKKNAHSTTDSIQQPSTLIHIEISSVLFFWLHCMATLRVNKQKGNKHTQFNKRKWKTQFHFVAQFFFFFSLTKTKTQQNDKTIEICVLNTEKETEGEQRKNKQIALPIGSESFIAIESTFLVTKSPYSPNTLF